MERTEEKVIKKKAQIDIAVLLIFFCREKPFRQVFDAVKQARPTRLYLYQDGPRKNNQLDIDGCKKCREIAEDIDWDCKIYRLYQVENQGCDPSEFIAQKWMFETEEMGIVLEDDDVASQSFFRFCKELLEYYKDDNRIQMICGMNNFDINTKINSSYFFSKKGSIWGWASWKRVIDGWDETYSWLNNKEALRLLKCNLKKEEYVSFIKTCKRHRASGRAHYESINGASMYLENRVNIVPKYNMITNVGIDAVSTHSVSDIRMHPTEIQKLFWKKRNEINFPLKHPQYLLIDQEYDIKYHKNFFHKIKLLLEKKIRNLFFR